MINLTIDARMLFSSGIGSFLFHMLPEIINSQDDFRISLLCDVEKVKNLDWVGREGVALIECRSSIYSLSEQMELPGKIPPDTNLFWSPHYNIPLIYRGGQVTTVHDIFHLADENEDKTFFKMIYARSMFRQVMKKSTLVIVDSEFTLSEMKKYNFRHLDKVRVVPGGANYKPQRSRDEALAAKGQHILFVGNVKPHKNLRRLVAAYKILREKNDISLPLLIVGEADSFITGIPGFREEISGSNWERWIKFSGRVGESELYDLYNHASLLVLPSLYEGFGLPPLEAMAFGCPVVVSKAASLPEVCGEAALYVDPLDIGDITEKINLVLRNETLKADLITRGFERIKLFDWKKAAIEYIQYFRGIL